MILCSRQFSTNLVVKLTRVAHCKHVWNIPHRFGRDNGNLLTYQTIHLNNEIKFISDRQNYDINHSQDSDSCTTRKSSERCETSIKENSSHLQLLRVRTPSHGRTTGHTATTHGITTLSNPLNSLKMTLSLAGGRECFLRFLLFSFGTSYVSHKMFN